MSSAEFQALLPLMLLAGTAVAVMLAAAFHQGHGTAVLISLLGLAITFASLFRVAPQRIGGLLSVDSYALFYLGLIVIVAFVVTIFSHGYLAKFHLKPEEYYMLLLLATLGACVIAASSHFTTFFLGLELLSVSLYVLIGYVFLRAPSMEAAVKYLILAAASSAFLLFGMALIYAELGSMSFGQLSTGLRSGVGGGKMAMIAGLVLMLTGIGFKLAVVPFHMWTPDIYQGAPAPVGAFVATASKGAMVALLFRFFGDFTPYQGSAVATVVAIIAVGSMTLGNLLALRQRNLKRILAYSSIAHLGYILIAFLAGGSRGIEAATFYLVAYMLATLGAFGLLAALVTRKGEPESVEDFTGLFWQRPWLALVFSAAVLSLIGLPLTAGFWGKFLVVIAGVNSGLWILVILLALNSAIGLYYYLRILVVACKAPDTPSQLPALPSGLSTLLGGIALLTLVLGVYPEPLLRLIRSLVMVGNY